MSEQKGWIGVDLDGTLAQYDKWRGIEHIGEPIPAMVDRVKAWLAVGKDVRIFTARVGPGRDSHERATAALYIARWCEKHLGQRLQVVCTKDIGMTELWDDRCVQVIANAGEPLRDKLARTQDMLAEALAEYEKATGLKLNPAWLEAGTKGRTVWITHAGTLGDTGTPPKPRRFLGPHVVDACAEHMSGFVYECPGCQSAMKNLRAPEGARWAGPPEYVNGGWWSVGLEEA